MMKVFSEKRGRGRNGADEPAPIAQDGESAGEHRIAQGFELLFGNHLREQREEIERLEAGVAERLEAVEAGIAQQARTLEELSDKASAALEREHDEYRRRKATEAELRQGLGELRDLVRTAVTELQERTGRIEASVEEERAASDRASGTDVERVQELLKHLDRSLAELRASKLDRAELASLFAAAACEIDPRSERVEQERSAA